MHSSVHPMRGLAGSLQSLQKVLLPPAKQSNQREPDGREPHSTAPSILAAQLQATDTAFAALIERNATFLYRIAHSLLRNPHDAEDAVQDCLLKLHRTGSWKQAENERAFLARACWRAALDRLPRKGAHYVEASDETLPQQDGVATPERNAIDSAQSARLHTLIDALPLQLREPLLLSGFDDLNSREIAAILHIPEGTVRTRLKRAREELRHRWEASTRKPQPPTRKEDR